MQTIPVPAIKIEVRDTDHEALLAIQQLLDGVEWTCDTPGEIARIMMQAGYRIRSVED